MNLFDKLVTEALKNQPSLSPLRVVVEKELLHHDILRIMSDNGLLKDLSFIGGTCLRYCYGGVRLSEDLDFTGGDCFTRDTLSEMGVIITKHLYDKYGLAITVSEPKKDTGNVDTWKIKVETRPEQKNFPSQCIHIDICAVPSYETRPMMLLNPYGIDMGTEGLIIQAQSREEIFVDKILAFALRPNRIKQRDLWDILWLHGKGIQPRIALISNKLRDRNLSKEYFFTSFDARKKSLQQDRNLSVAFTQEMRRFLPVAQIDTILKQDNLWQFLVNLLDDVFICCHNPK